MAEFNLINPIPQHRKVVITNSGSSESIVGIPLILDEEVSIKVESQYGELWQGSSNNLMTLLASSSKNIPSGQFALQGLQIWKKTEPIKLSFNVHVEMDTDPIQDVLDPIRVLMCKVLPHYGNGGEISKDDEGLIQKAEGYIEQKWNIKLKTLIPPGPNLQTIIASMSADNNSNTIPNSYDVIVGWCKFRNMVITSIDPKFSKDVCYVNNKPYPISAEVSIQVSTLEIATTNMIVGMLQ